MLYDWQTIAVALIILAALAYALRRGWARVGSMRAGASSPPAPACGNCPGGETKAAAPPRPNVIVQIGRARTPRD